MALFKHRCLAEDPSDKINYVWCAILFITLASACWIAPIALNINVPSCKQGSIPESERITVNASCWTPQQFTDTQMKYAHTVCKQAMEAFLNKEANSSSIVKAKLYKWLEPKSDLSKSDEPLSYPDFLTQKEKVSHEKKKTKNIMRESIPVFLFLLGVVFVVPKLIWSYILSFGSLNIDGTLSVLTDMKDRNSSYVRRIGTTLNVNLKKSSCMAFGYLLIKLLYVLVCIVGCLYLILCIQDDFDKSADYKPYSQTSRQISQRTPYVDTVVCGFDIRSLSNIDVYALQCVFVEEDRADETNLQSPELCRDDLTDWSSSYSAVLAVTREVLILMAVINIIQLVTWLVRLVCGKNGVNGQSSMDQRLVRHFAFIYVDCLTSIEMGMQNSGSGRDLGDGDQKEELQPL